ncbi:hypothetical protein [Povalibacter sp.]|uniref:hypothetical protein n=1 Tax=Povalibacter sp. TaxID=1962978 RepID=UPI002F40613C
MTSRKSSPSVGALFRKPLTWPPACPPTGSEAPRLAQRREWQPRTWTKDRIAS